MKFLVPVFMGAVAIAFLAGRWHGIGHERTIWEHRMAEQRAALQAQAREAAEKSVETVIKYVDRVERVEVKVPVVRSRLVRVCDAAADSVPVSGAAGDPDAGTGADAADRQSDRTGELAAELTACRRNAERLNALTEWVRNNQKEP